MLRTHKVIQPVILYHNLLMWRIMNEKNLTNHGTSCVIPALLQCCCLSLTARPGLPHSFTTINKKWESTQNTRLTVTAPFLSQRVSRTEQKVQRENFSLISTQCHSRDVDDWVRKLWKTQINNQRETHALASLTHLLSYVIFHCQKHQKFFFFFGVKIWVFEFELELWSLWELSLFPPGTLILSLIGFNFIFRLKKKGTDISFFLKLHAHLLFLNLE